VGKSTIEKAWQYAFVMVQWYNGSMVQWYNGLMVQGYRGDIAN